MTDESGSAIPALIPDNMSLEELRAKVKELFPGFKSQGILRFSSLLGPGKPSSQPRIWREARKPKKRRRKKITEEGCSWTLDIDHPVPAHMVVSDDEVFTLTHSLRQVQYHHSFAYRASFCQYHLLLSRHQHHQLLLPVRVSNLQVTL